MIESPAPAPARTPDMLPDGRRVRPLFGTVLARRLPARMSVGRVLLPDVAAHPPAEAVIVAVGTGAVQKNGTLRPLPFEVGQHILVAKYGGTAVNGDDPLLLLFRVEDILGVIRNS